MGPVALRNRITDYSHLVKDEEVKIWIESGAELAWFFMLARGVVFEWKAKAKNGIIGI
jgi:hypothetical protein